MYKPVASRVPKSRNIVHLQSVYLDLVILLSNINLFRFEPCEDVEQIESRALTPQAPMGYLPCSLGGKKQTGRRKRQI